MHRVYLLYFTCQVPRFADAVAANPLQPLFHRRWCVPILAALHEGRGAKFVTLCHRLAAHQGAVRQSLDHLVEIGLVERSPGYGHPLRPEYILTRRGGVVAPACLRLDGLMGRTSPEVREVSLRRWSMPVLHAIGDLRPARFNAIAARFDGITDRSLALALTNLAETAWIERGVEVTHRPPLTLYLPTENAADLLAALDGLARAA